MTEDTRRVFEEELKSRGLNWCRGCEEGNHKRGFVLHRDLKTVHLDSEVALEKSLYRGLHEIGHCVTGFHGLRSYQAEEAAHSFAVKLMHEKGFRVPRIVAQQMERYIQRKKRHGDNIRKGRTK